MTLEEFRSSLGQPAPTSPAGVTSGRVPGTDSMRAARVRLPPASVAGPRRKELAFATLLVSQFLPIAFPWLRSWRSGPISQ